MVILLLILRQVGKWSGIKKLQDMHVDYGQGYGIEQPRPIEEIFSLDEEKKSPSLKVIHNKP